MRILRIQSGLGLTELMRKLDGLDAVALREGIASSKEEFELADHLAKSAFSKKTNIARQLRYEFLLWISGKTDIKSAMAETSPEKNEFFVVVFSDAKPDAVCRMLEAKELPLRLNKNAEALAIERISLSRIM
ncbi:MAG: hypothetical protein V1827_01450 [Candidatus Micrarchaeota archaeon]